MEIALYPHLLRDLDKGRLKPLAASNSYLLEPPFQPFREDLLDVVPAFMDAGKNVIIAHPERIPFFQQNSEALFRLVERGAELQVNLGSLLGNFGKKTKKFSLLLAKNDVIHYVASDSHGPHKRRPPAWKEWEMLADIRDISWAVKVCCDNPGQLLDKEPTA
jgi:protein-tyrosine phosphatase